MAELDSQMHWVISENVARYQEMLKSETDTCRRKMLEDFLVLEQQKLRAASHSLSQSFGAAAGKASEHDQTENEQGDGAPQRR